ncbi:hypothetical protein [Nocardioides sp. YIM 152315]|uniref:hypothetical protein n=1 Tax=Nocardioides sp. YIM 152315 TaxID=3031760 RepID=UPI0023DC5EB6|nr:hypothetical protein [Nocardioides sp. YIM 152315]MDF1603380.1 hypothetical protein [Nocardioides sp. YIM 152315]
MTAAWHTLTARVRFDPAATDVQTNAGLVIGEALAKALGLEVLWLDTVCLVVDNDDPTEVVPAQTTDRGQEAGRE